MRSGREEEVDTEGLEKGPDGIPEGAGCGTPKKSRPKRESAGFACLGGVDTFGWDGRIAGASVVLGRAGGDGICPKVSGLGWADDDFRCDDDRSSLAFSWTTLSG